ncbi:hypothetical protein CVT25_009346 [Psilocybe cyanescens]|uniref:Uncharacterized protein n=1 Tax=Psilocybe cyanescens TaxID=93625 RepID=A0A409XJA2_PSICY|nr:hypothetical protein CVT25_009346 [Psilocybe cyanescens]
MPRLRAHGTATRSVKFQEQMSTIIGVRRMKAIHIALCGFRTDIQIRSVLRQLYSTVTTKPFPFAIDVVTIAVGVNTMAITIGVIIRAIIHSIKTI